MKSGEWNTNKEDNIWINKGLDSINADLKNMEMEKRKKEKKRIHESKLKKEREAEQKALESRSTKQKILNKDNYTKLKQSDVWSKTIGERHALDVFREKISGYSPKSVTQKKVIHFSIADVDYIKFDDPRELDSYISASRYWNKKSVEITGRMEDHTDKKLKIVYAENKEMGAVITEYLGRMIITSGSSFENILKKIEGKSWRKL